MGDEEKANPLEVVWTYLNKSAQDKEEKIQNR